MAETIRAGEVAVTTTEEGERLDGTELMAKAVEVWPLDAIEEALGADADRILPPALRLVDLHVRIRECTPRCWSISRRRSESR